MCLSFQKFQRRIGLMFSSDNPDRICKRNSTSGDFGCCIFITFTLISIIIITYFITVGFGLFYSITTSTNTSCINCVNCNNDNNFDLYLGCFFIGTLYDITLIGIGLCIYLLYRCFDCWICPLMSNIKSEFVTAFETAVNMETGYVPDTNSVNLIINSDVTEVEVELEDLEEVELED